jgi:preprotein translocase subunit SecF
MKGIRVLPQDTAFNFIGLRIVALAFSLAILIGSVVLTAQDGLNFGIDFTGGTVIEIAVQETPDLGQLRKDLNAAELGAISIQEFGSPTDLMIRMPQQSGGPSERQQAISKVHEIIDGSFESNVQYRRTEFVGPQVGEELKKAGLFAILFSLGGILVYIWFRFEWHFGLAAIIALAHDAIATVGLFAITQMEFNLSTVAAILMIAGYSINDTVVVFDRIRENLRKYKKKPLPEVLNMSINQMLGRTLITSVTTMLALVALWVFGGEVIQSFIYALIFGIAIGTYSSIFVASPVLMLLNLKRNNVAGSGSTGEGNPQEQEA